MFDIGALELLLIVIVAVLVIGPKDMPAAMRTAGRWIGQVRKVSAHFRTGVDAMVREAELEDMEKKWKARNEEIMRQHPAQPSSDPANLPDALGPPTAESAATMTGPAADDPPSDQPSGDDAAQPAPDTAPTPGTDKTADKA